VQAADAAAGAPPALLRAAARRYNPRVGDAQGDRERAGDPPPGGALLVVLRSPGWEARFEATALAVTAAALGDRVVVALFGDALRAFAAGRFDDGAPASGSPVGSLSRMLDEGRQGLGLEVVACETAIRVAGLDPAAVGPALDAVRSLPEIWQHARRGRVLAL